MYQFWPVKSIFRYLDVLHHGVLYQVRVEGLFLVAYHDILEGEVL